MLARAGLGDDPAFAEPPRQHRLAESVVELVCPRVEQVLALQVEALVRGEAFDKRERCRPAAVGAAEFVEFRSEPRVSGRLRPAPLKFFKRGDQRFGHIASAVGTVKASPRKMRRIFLGLHRAAATNARTRS